MHAMRHWLTQVFLLVGCLSVTPATGLAHDGQDARERLLLEQHLPPGKARGFYHHRLQEMGYHLIASVYNAPTRYAEYLMEKDGQRYTILLTLTETGRANTVTVAENASEAAASPFSRAAAAGQPEWQSLLHRQMGRLRRALPPGHTDAFYEDRLIDRGWKISDTTQYGPSYIEYELVRGNLTAELQLRLDPETGRAAQVAVVENPIHTPATERALARNRRLARLAKTDSSLMRASFWSRTAPSQCAENEGQTQERKARARNAMTPYSDRDLAALFHHSDRARAWLQRRQG